MGELMAGLQADERRRRRTVLLVVLGCVAAAGAWLTAPFGVVLLTRGEAGGSALVAAGVVLAGAAVAFFIAARRIHRAPESTPGKANPVFDEPRPSQDPRGGYSMVGSQLGSR